jgi:imidazolonepropionase-like amidohydrolase
MILLRTGQSVPFVDAHVHIRDARGLDAVRAAGVVAVRDAGIRESSFPQKESEGRRDAGPVIISARWAIYKKGGYGSVFGAAVEDRDELSSEIIKLARAGAGIIKVMASGMVSLRAPGMVTAGGFSEEELRFIVQEAGKAGLGVMAHANGSGAVISAVRAGVRSIEHGFYMTEADLNVMAEAKTFWVPTVGALARAAQAATVTEKMRKFIAALIQEHLTMVRKAHSIGVPLAIGTDCVLPDPEYRKKYDDELSYFEQAGIPRHDVIKIACEGGARLLGI